MNAVVSIQGTTIVLPFVSSVGPVDNIGILFAFTVTSGAYATAMRFKDVDDARTARKELVQALSDYWSARLTMPNQS